jgi:hypothetical protein
LGPQRSVAPAGAVTPERRSADQAARRPGVDRRSPRATAEGVRGVRGRRPPLSLCRPSLPDALVRTYRLGQRYGLCLGRRSPCSIRGAPSLLARYVRGNWSRGRPGRPTWAATTATSQRGSESRRTQQLVSICAVTCHLPLHCTPQAGGRGHSNSWGGIKQNGRRGLTLSSS